jgi:hypothetical protein
MTRDQAVSFIRDTLGCACSDEILCAISRETRDNPDLCRSLLALIDSHLDGCVDQILAVCGRLLVLRCNNTFREEAVRIVKGAIRLRETLGFNRVRIVLEFGSDAVRDLVLPDDRVHLHYLSPDHDK